MNRRFFLVVLASVMLASTTTTSFAEEGESFRYGLQGNNLVFTTAEKATKGGAVRLVVNGGQRAKISVELVDLVANASGAKQPIPLNSSPFTPHGLVQLTERYPTYEPSSEFQSFDISIKFKDDVVLDRPVLGGISISLVPEKKSEEPVSAESSIVATFAYMPSTGINLEEYYPGLSLTGPTIARITPDFFPLSLLPDLPFALNHGDVTMSYQLENSGKVFLETSLKQSVEQVGLFGQEDTSIFSASTEKFLLPGQISEETSEVASSDSINRMLGIGLYRFTVSATGEMGDQIDTSASNQQLLIIFPWKQSLLALGLLILVRRRIYRAFKSVLDLIRAFRDFLRSQNQRPNLVSQPRAATPVLVTTSSRVATNSTLRPLYVPTASANKSTATDQVPDSPGARPLYPYWYQPPTNGS